MDLSNYQEVPLVANVASKLLAEFYEKQGRPKSPFSKGGEKVVNMIIKIWTDLYPKEVEAWTKDRKDYKESEMDIKQQVKKRTGRSLASYPYPIYRMLKVTFPEVSVVERKNCMKMVKKWPMFRLANKV